MKTYKFILSICLLALIIVAASCQKDEKPSVGFTMKATGAGESTGTTPAQEPTLTTSGNPSNDVPLQFTWNEAWIYITRLEFSAHLISQSVSQIFSISIKMSSWIS